MIFAGSGAPGLFGLSDSQVFAQLATNQEKSAFDLLVAQPGNLSGQCTV
jgi:hypothetical protein